ncbi:MAG TPA: hypothetical protein VJT32_11940 [bacterium]|nr:hypothetical protein [bacterium]
MPDDRTARGGAPDGVPPPAPVGREGWTAAKPERLPSRTLWPVWAALGIVLLLWGVVTAYLVAAAGAVLLSMAALGWIGEVRRER